MKAKQERKNLKPLVSTQQQTLNKHSLTPNEKQIKDLNRKLNPKTSRKL